MSFSKILHGIQSGNDGDLDTARPYISKFCVSGQDPLFFFVRQGKAPREILENLAGSHDCFTGDNVCRFPMKKKGQIYIFPLKIFQKGDCWA